MLGKTIQKRSESLDYLPAVLHWKDPDGEYTDSHWLTQGSIVCFDKIVREFVLDCDAAKIDNEAYDNALSIGDVFFYITGCVGLLSLLVLCFIDDVSL